MQTVPTSNLHNAWTIHLSHTSTNKTPSKKYLFKIYIKKYSKKAG